VAEADRAEQKARRKAERSGNAAPDAAPPRHLPTPPSPGSHSSAHSSASFALVLLAPSPSPAVPRQPANAAPQAPLPSIASGAAQRHPPAAAVAGLAFFCTFLIKLRARALGAAAPFADAAGNTDAAQATHF